MKLIKEEEERNQEKYFLMFIGVWFILNGFYLIIFGVATFKLNCLITYLVLMAYFFTYVIAVNSGSMILAIIVVFVIGSTLIIIFIVKYKDIDPFAYFTFYGLAFSAFGLLITNIVFVASEAEIELLPIILLSLCLFFFLLGFFLAACVFERIEDVDDDGELDLVVANSGSGQVLWYRNLGGLSFVLGGVVADNIDNPYCLEVVDIDGAQNLGDPFACRDFLIGGKQAIYLARNDGDGNFVVSRIVSPSNANSGFDETISTCRAIKAIDLDNDRTTIDFVYITNAGNLEFSIG